MARRKRQRAPLHELSLICWALCVQSAAVEPLAAVLPWSTTSLSSPPLAANQDVSAVWISPDGKTAVYGVHHEGDPGQFRDLRCVRLDGLSDSVSLVAGLSDAFRYGSRVEFSPDSRRVAFTIEVPSGAATAQELWGAPVCPASITPVRLAPAGTPEMFAMHYLIRWAPNSQRVLFSVDHETHNEHRIFSAHALGAAGGATVELGGALIGESFLNIFEPTGDSQRVLLGRRDGSGFVDLVSVPIAGPAASEIVIVEGTTAGVVYPYFKIVGPEGAGGSGRVVYLWSDASGGVQNELWSAPVAGPSGQQVRLNPALVVGGNVQDFAITPDGTRVVYTADQGTNGLYELYSVPIAGPSTSFVKLNSQPAAGGDGVERWSAYGFRITPDSSRVVFLGKLHGPTLKEIYSVPVVGPAAACLRLNEGTPSGGGYDAFHLTRDGSVVLFAGTETVAANGYFHVRPSDGGGFELHLGCGSPAEATPVPSGDGFYLNCKRTADPVQALHHFRIRASPLSAIVFDATPLDDFGVPVQLRGGHSGLGTALVLHDSPAVGVYELWAVDRRLVVNGFETGDMAGWSAVSP